MLRMVKNFIFLMTTAVSAGLSYAFSKINFYLMLLASTALLGCGRS